MHRTPWRGNPPCFCALWKLIRGMVTSSFVYTRGEQRKCWYSFFEVKEGSGKRTINSIYPLPWVCILHLPITFGVWFCNGPQTITKHWSVSAQWQPQTLNCGSSGSAFSAVAVQHTVALLPAACSEHSHGPKPLTQNINRDYLTIHRRFLCGWLK